MRTLSANQELIHRYKDEPAPLLAVLHAFHDRDGVLTDEVLREVAGGLGIPLAELFGTVTFYHHFSRPPATKDRPRVCTGLICRLRGSRRLLQALDGLEMPCAGRCDEPTPVLCGARQMVGGPGGELEARPTPLPTPNPGGCEECVFASIRQPFRASLRGYGDYAALRRALEGMTPEQVVELLAASKLAGRGGAGFPTGTKWRLVARAPGEPKTVVCNADEGEPGCFKDRTILTYDPHAVLEGMALAGYATGARRGFIYLRYEYPEVGPILEAALAEAEQAGFLGHNVCGAGFDFRVYLRRGAGAYVCGEEGSLLNSLEGKRPFPRNRPPYPVTHGFEDLPTAVNNVETLACVAPIVRNGADWYQGLGTNGQAGTKVISLSGDVQRPGNYEVPLGLSLSTLLNDWAGGPGPGRRVQAVTMAGLSGGFLAGEDLQVTLDEASIRAKGSFLGAGGIMVLDDRRDMLEVAAQAMEFFAHESCGKCFPCRIGTRRLAERLRGEAGPQDPEEWSRELIDVGTTMKATSACGLGVAAPLITESLQRYFPELLPRRNP